jgi:glycosyltransferase involved in cell wall biosynthesis
MKVGVDLREIRVGVSGGLRRALNGVLEELIRNSPDDEFHIFVRDRAAAQHWEETGPRRLEILDDSLDCGAVDRRASALGLDVLFRGFPGGLHGFPPDRQIAFIPDIAHEAMPELFDASELRARRRRFGAALAQAGAIGTLTEFMRQRILEHADLRTADVFLMPPGPPANGLAPTPNHHVSGKPYLFFPANQWPHKNHRRLFQALRRTRELGALDVELLLTGHADEGGALSEHAAGLPVRHLGYVSDAEIGALYAGARAVVYPTLYEGFGMPLLEAFHYGVPVLSGKYPTVIEVGGDAIHTVDATDVDALADGLLRISTDTELRAKLVEAGRLRASRYSWRHSADELRGALRRVAAAGARPTRRTPLVSVVIALTDHRERALACVKSVADHQSASRDDYEVITVADGKDSTLEKPLEASLGPEGRLLRYPSKNGMELLAVGARAARGQILLFVEAHCVLEADTIREVAAFFGTGLFDGACLTALQDSPNDFARMEGLHFDKHFHEWSRDDDWRKVMVRGFAVLRWVYGEVHELPWRYGLFAERAFAATLHARGFCLGWARQARVVHTNTTNYAMLRDSIEDFVKGEVAYRAENDPAYCGRYFGEPAEYSDVPVDWSAAYDVIAALFRAGGVERAREGLHIFEAALFGRGARIARAHVDVLAARVRYALRKPSEGARLQAFLDMWDRTATLARLRALASGAVRHPPKSRTNGAAAHAVWEPTENRGAFGLHPVEWRAGRPFRWTRGIAGFHLRAAHAKSVATIHTTPVGKPRPLALFWKRRRLVPLQVEPSRIAIELPDAGSPDGWLVILSECMRQPELAPQETRRLGLPVFGIEVTSRS